MERQQGVYYEVDSECRPLGIGGMGKVYAGICVNEQTGERRPVAIKFMYEDLPAEALERTRREASIQLRNDNLIEMLGFSETEDIMPDGSVAKHYHVASELLDGVTLADLLEGKLNDVYGNQLEYAVKLYQEYQSDSCVFAEKIVNSVLAGVLALHNAGYIHRDIDPSNIMITSDGRIKLIDFGIAKKIETLGTMDGSFTVSGQFIGKPEYAAPELAYGDVRSQNETTDIYAIGILLFQCITGHVPFKGPHHEVLEKQKNSKLPLKEIKNKRLRDIVRKATEKIQSKRYQNAAEFLTALSKKGKTDIDEYIDFTDRKVIIVTGLIGLTLGALSAFFVCFI